jgi:protein-S-isoprenylcysteine O-methyltransferase Ste14
MKKLLFSILSTVITLVLFLGTGLIISPAIVNGYPFWVVFLATFIGYISQPKFKKSDLWNPHDCYSMLGILIMLVVVTNLSLIEFSLSDTNDYTFKHNNFIGFILIWIGLVIRIYSIQILGRSFSNDVSIKVEHQLYSKKIYAYIRHPSYLGAILSIIGTSFWLESWQTFPILMIVTIVAYYHRITHEEKILLNHFGEKYAKYCQKTGALLPKMRFTFLFKKKLDKM